MTDISDIIRERVRARRQALGIDQAELARAIDVDHSTVTNQEAGRSSISAAQFAAFAKVLRVPPATSSATMDRPRKRSWFTKPRSS